MIIDEETAQDGLRGIRGYDCGIEIASFQHPATPAAEQGLHAVQNLRVVVDAQNRHPGELRRVGAHRASLRRRPADRSRDRHLDRKGRAAPGIRFQYDRMAEHTRDALDDGETKTEAPRNLGTVLQTVE